MNPLSQLLARHVRDESTPTCLPRLTLHQSACTTDPVSSTYLPVFCVVAQGRKDVFVGDEAFTYEPMTYLVASAHLPVTGQITEAPYLALSLRLEPGMLAEVVRQMPLLGSSLGRAFRVTQLEEELLDSVLRFVRLLDRPGDAAVLGPLVEREILYRLLLSPHGPMLRQLSLATSELSHLNRAIAYIREHYDRPVLVGELARIAHMSEATFHRHFKAATSMSPLQFQKQIRLQEARHLLLSRDLDAAMVGYTVGYESPSQFSREYRRLFGAPPGKDSKRALRSLGSRALGVRASA